MAAPRARGGATDGRPAPAPSDEPSRSNAAIPAAIIVVLIGIYLGRYSVLLPAFIGLLLLGSGFSFLSSRINPLSTAFYLTRKPSWAAVGVVFLGALVLLGAAYEMWLHGLGPLFPHL